MSLYVGKVSAGGLNRRLVDQGIGDTFAGGIGTDSATPAQIQTITELLDGVSAFADGLPDIMLADYITYTNNHNDRRVGG